MKRPASTRVPAAEFFLSTNMSAPNTSSAKLERFLRGKRTQLFSHTREGLSARNLSRLVTALRDVSPEAACFIMLAKKLDCSITCGKSTSSFAPQTTAWSSLSEPAVTSFEENGKVAARSSLEAKETP